MLFGAVDVLTGANREKNCIKKFVQQSVVNLIKFVKMAFDLNSSSLARVYTQEKLSLDYS